MATSLPASFAEREETAWLVMVRTPGVGPRGAQRVLEQFGSPQALLAASPSRRQQAGLSRRSCDWLAAPDWSVIAADLAWLAQADHHLVTLADPRYPALLRESDTPPPALFVRGDPALLGAPQLAIVGSRNPTPSGRETAFAFARHLASAGLVITSGLAAGIDGAAHRGAVAGGGATIAVMGTGADRIYPAVHRDLAHDVVHHGALVTEFPLGTRPAAGHFPRRNRIISALSLGTLVVEAAPRSGSLITARLAAEQGREVFAIPGSIHNPQARGCHRLIRDGAKLVETAADILEELGQLAGVLANSEAPEPDVEADDSALDASYQALLGHLDDTPAPVDLLVARSGLTAETVSSMLLVLELQGYVSSAAGGRYARIARPRGTP